MEKISVWLYLLSLDLFLVDIVILLPISIFKKVRRITGKMISISSYIFGFAMWFLCAILTFYYWGPAGLIIGLVLIGIGVVPMAIIACIIAGAWSSIGMVLLGIALTVISRMLGIFIYSSSVE